VSTLDIVCREEEVRATPGSGSASFLRGLIDGMRCGVLSVDVEGRLALMNGQAQRLLALSRCPAPGTPLWQALPRHPRLVQLLSSSFRMTSLPNRAELQLDDGRSIGFTVSLVRDPAGEPCGAAMFFKDLTPIEHREEQERLKDRLAALGQMAASIAHEIRNPLAAIEVTCKLLERRLVDQPACRDLLGKVAAEVQRLNRSVDCCLQYVRPVTPTLAVAELAPMLEEAIVVAVGRRGKSGIEVRRAFAPSIPPFLMDRGLLRQVFVNLVLNALEAVGEKGRVTVTAGLEPAPDAASIPYSPAGASGDPWADARELAIVRVADNGPGIDEEDRDRVFQPFFTTKTHGSGVGLAVAKKIVGGHRGMIDVTRAPQGGAEIVVRLPIVRRSEDLSA
jgi:nitrogen-specific signal transduction histidine kinase